MHSGDSLFVSCHGNVVDAHLNRIAEAVLKAHRLRRNEERLHLGDLWEDRDLVLPNRVGNSTNHNNHYRRDCRSLLRKAGLQDKGFTFHTLRHSFATTLFNKGEHPKVVQSLMDHSSIVQMMDTYSHLLDDIGGDAVGGLEEAFG